MSEIQPVSAAAAAIVGLKLIEYLLNRLRKVESRPHRTEAETVTPSLLFDAAWIQRMEESAGRTIGLATEIKNLEWRLGVAEDSQKTFREDLDLHKREDALSHERIAILEQQFHILLQTIKEGNSRYEDRVKEVKGAIERVMQLLEDMLKDHAERLRLLELGKASKE